MNEQDKQDGNGIKKSKGDFLLRIISVLSAILIWFWVVSVESYVTTRTFTLVPVGFENLREMRENYEYSVFSFTETYINVTLEGKYSDLNRVKNSDIHAYIDLRGVSKAGKQSLHIKIDGIDYISVVDQSLDSASVYVDKPHSDEFPIEWEIVDIDEIPPDIDIGNLILTPDKIRIYGPKEEVDKLAHIKLNFYLGEIEEPKEFSMPVPLNFANHTENFILIDNKGNEVENQYLETQALSAIEVYVPVTMTKEVPLTVNYKYGYYNEKNTSISINPATVKIKGSPYNLNRINEIVIGEIDEKEHAKGNPNEPFKIPLDLSEMINFSPSEEIINLSDVTEVDVDIKYTDLDVKTVNVSTSENDNFRIIEPGNGLEYHIQEKSISIKILGPPEILNEINETTSDGIIVTANFDALTRGTHKVILTVKLDDNIIRNHPDSSKLCHFLDESTVTVEIY